MVSDANRQRYDENDGNAAAAAAAANSSNSGDNGNSGQDVGPNGFDWGEGKSCLSPAQSNDGTPLSNNLNSPTKKRKIDALHLSSRPLATATTEAAVSTTAAAAAAGEAATARPAGDAAAGAAGEVWDLEEVFHANNITNNPTECQGKHCDLVACCAWKSNLEPKPWNCCLDCQDLEFDGWPEGKLPIRILTPELRHAMMEKCTRFLEPSLPCIPWEEEANNAPAVAESGATNESAAAVGESVRYLEHVAGFATSAVGPMGQPMLCLADMESSGAAVSNVLGGGLKDDTTNTSLGFSNYRRPKKDPERRIVAPVDLQRETTIADPTSIDPKHVSHTMMGVADASIVKKYGRNSAYDYAGGDINFDQCKVQRMFDAIKVEHGSKPGGEKLVNFVDTFLTISNDKHSFDCSNCGITIKPISADGLAYRELLRHVFGGDRQHKIDMTSTTGGCINKDKSCVCGYGINEATANPKGLMSANATLSSHKTFCAVVKTIDTLNDWRKANPRATHVAKANCSLYCWLRRNNIKPIAQRMMAYVENPNAYGPKKMKFAR